MVVAGVKTMVVMIGFLMIVVGEYQNDREGGGGMRAMTVVVLPVWE